MEIKAVRLHGKNDLRFETIKLRDIGPNEALAKVICDGVCMSSYKTLQRGKLDSVYPPDTEKEPVIIGHELAAEIIEVGENVADKYKPGDRFGVQAAMEIDGISAAPGYQFIEFGGAATHIIIPDFVLKSDFMIWFDKEMPFYQVALGEPYACLIFALYSNFHTEKFVRDITPGIREGGNMSIMGGCGPMGIGCVELVMNMKKRPALIVVTDMDQLRINQAKRIIPPDYAAQKGIKLLYVNTSLMENPVDELRALTNEEGFHDTFIMCPVREVIELADAVCAYSCCINFFSGPVDTNLKALINFHQVHYQGKHIIGSASSAVIDMQEVVEMAHDGHLRTEVMVTHIGGLNCTVDVISNLPSVPGGKKLIYSNIDMELTAIEDFHKKNSPLFKELDAICKRNNMMWCGEAEAYLLKHGKSII